MTDAGHFDEESLIHLAEDRVDQDTHPHLVDCLECRSAVVEYRTMLTSFADDSTWGAPLDETPNPQTIANLRGFVEQMHREDAEAEPLVAELLAGPREEWMPRLTADEKYRTAGVVRKLIAMMPSAVRATPRDAEAISMVATAIADALIDRENCGEEVDLLRGATWRERAFAEFYIGEHDKAASAIEISLQSLADCRVGEFEFSRSRIVRSLLYRTTDDLQAGIQEIEQALTQFVASGQVSRVASALITKTALLSKAGDFRISAAIAEQVLSDYSAILSDEQRATLHVNLAYFYRELGDLARALENFDVAAFMLDGLNMKGDAIRSRWNIALMFGRVGNLKEALTRLRNVSSEFESLGMCGAAVLASLDAAEIHVTRQEYCEVESICERAIEQFRRTGLGNTSRAMLALGLLREASRRRNVPTTLFQDVVVSVRRLPEQTRQLTLPPPSEPS
ncbi:MAG TPA: tetratricopeptide repeat protein [Thermoanaerobaculia bacterium]|jgi:tetratricopeptide (TPR) repeat protein|nr:tetratricopeptide repeat protein [Thermoanaerobaculia bacterium]